ncbi:MAG: EpsG family protein, partial [Eubacterium sp.]
MWANRCIIFIIMIITLLYLAVDKNNYNKKSCVQVVTVILTCFSGFRSWQMGDVFHYCSAYLDCNMPGWELDMESRDTIGLQLFFHWAGRLGLSFEVCLFIIAAFTAITIGVLVYRYSPSPYWSYLIYIAMGFYMASFDILKQVIAMGFIVIAMIFIIEKKTVKFL